MCVCKAVQRHGSARLGASRHNTTRHDTTRHGTMLRCAALALLCAVLAHAEPEKRAEMPPAPFVMGSRYGRSPERVMSPRNDRFFMGSRYGKRAEATPAVGALPAECGGRAAACGGRLLCEYTGVLSLFKCVRAQKHLQFSRRSADDSGAGELGAGGEEE